MCPKVSEGRLEIITGVPEGLVWDKHKESLSNSVKGQGELTLFKPHYYYVYFIHVTSFYPYNTVLGARLSCPGFQ